MVDFAGHVTCWGCAAYYRALKSVEMKIKTLIGTLNNTKNSNGKFLERYHTAKNYKVYIFDSTYRRTFNLQFECAYPRTLIALLSRWVVSGWDPVRHGIRVSIRVSVSIAVGGLGPRLGAS